MRPLALLAMAVAVVGVSACATSLTDEFQARYSRRASIAKDGKLAAFLDETAPDYVIRLENGQTMTRNQLAQRLEVYFRDQLIEQLSFAYIVRNVAARGDQVIVEVEQRDRRIQRRQDGKNHVVEANVLHTDRWIRTPAGWRLQFTQEGRQLKFTVDGQPVP